MPYEEDDSHIWMFSPTLAHDILYHLQSGEKDASQNKALLSSSPPDEHFVINYGHILNLPPVNSDRLTPLIKCYTLIIPVIPNSLQTMITPYRCCGCIFIDITMVKAHPSISQSAGVSVNLFIILFAQNNVTNFKRKCYCNGYSL